MEVSTGVVQDYDGDWRLESRGERLVEIVKLSDVVSTSRIDVTVITLPNYQKRSNKSLISKLLQNLVLTNNSRVIFSELVRNRFGVHSVIFSAENTVFRITSTTCINIKSIVSKRRLDLIRINKQEAVELGGVDKLYGEMKESLEASRNVLLSGPSGCGKSALVTKVASDLHLPCQVIDCSSLARPEPGESEAELRQVWDKMKDIGGGVLVLDNIDCISRGNRITSQLMSLLDSCQHTRDVIVVGVTTQSHCLDIACRRHGRFETEIVIKNPDKDERRDMIKVLCDRNNVDLSNDMMVEAVQSTAGYLVSDLSLLVTRISRLSTIDLESLETEMINTRPAQLRSGLGSVKTEKVSWDSLGGLHDAKTKLIRAVQLPLTHPDSFSRLGIRPSKGVLLSGPPGCGKTRLVRAVATTCHVTFLSVSAAEIFSPYVGDSERAIVEVFTKARQSAPALLFIDEIETLVAGRDISANQSSSDRVLAALLTEMDGLGGDLGGGVVVVGATNRPQILDSALTRPGRLDTHIVVQCPDHGERQEIIKTVVRNVPHDNIDIVKIADITDGYTGADIECVVRESVLSQLSHNLETCKLEQKYLEDVICKYNPSLSRSTTSS